MSANGWHAVAATIILAAYVVLTITGQDGTPVLALLGGQAVGAAVERKTTS